MANHRYEVYQSPLVTRNASPEMAELFSPRRRILTWRRLWIALAEAQHELGLPVTARQIGELKRALEDIDFRKAARYEQQLRHDVMAHVHAFGDVAPGAKAILHLGATSAFVVDNADLIIMRDALGVVEQWLANAIDALGTLASRYHDLPTVGFTHYQPAQLTTVGKRAALWCHDFVMDLNRLEFEVGELKFRGARGATGTQASFLELFGGDAGKTRELDRLVAEKVGFEATYPVVGQTYPRKVDAHVAGCLAGIATSVHKLANDVRLLSNLKEVEEPFESKQVGSSAMPYKRNPMRCERATGLARFVLSLSSSPYHTAAEQWFERTLDDSSNRRLSIPEAFLATDGMLVLVTDVARGLVVHPEVIQAHVVEALPEVASEHLLMLAVKAGGDRQELHERIRRHARGAAARHVDHQTAPDDLLERLRGDPAFEGVDLSAALEPENFTGLAADQTSQFIKAYVEPVRRKYRRVLEKPTNLKV